MFSTPEISSDVRITRITYVEVTGKSPKMIGKNAVKDDHGDTNRERLVRVFTNSGHEGFGVTRATADAIEAETPKTLGVNPASLVDAEQGITLRGIEHALWDLIGKITGKPVYALLGASCRDTIDAYDGGLYFCDLVYPELGLARVEQEAAESVEQGHRAIKMKIGRGHKWMPPEEGFSRDVDAIRLVRQTIGPDIKLMVDGNNGFDEAGAERLLEAVGDQDIYWAEEMFPETIEDYTKFRAFLDRNGLKTLIADGETLAEPSPLYPFIEQHLIDVVQLDTKRIGLSAWWRLAAFSQVHDRLCAPHTWGSRFAVYVTAHLGKVIPNFLSDEIPVYNPDAYHPTGFTFKDGAYTLSDMPGWGLEIDKQVYQTEYAPTERQWEV
jgi:L-alanine-DL-glutamate epimerase-like enolase superfamily enzyme